MSSKDDLGRLDEITQRYGFDQLDGAEWTGTPLADLLWLVRELKGARARCDDWRAAFREARQEVTDVCTDRDRVVDDYAAMEKQIAAHHSVMPSGDLDPCIICDLAEGE